MHAETFHLRFVHDPGCQFLVLAGQTLDEEGVERFEEARNSLDLYAEELEFMDVQGITPLGISNVLELE